MKSLIILGISVICFSDSSFGQINDISVERFFENLPNRIYYTDRTSIADTVNQIRYFDVEYSDKYQPAIQVFKISNADIYGSLNEINNYYYWVPDIRYEPKNLLEVSFPGNRDVLLSHNKQPLVSSQLEYNQLQKELYSFSYDMHLLDRYSDYINEYSEDSLPGMLLLTLMSGGVSYLAFTTDTRSGIENIASKGLGVFTVSLTVGGIVELIRDRRRLKNYSNKRDEIIQKYNQ